ncbi:MAG: ribonuclease P protein component [Duodenibacillus sp.]
MQNRTRYRFPKSARIVSSEDFGRLLRSRDAGGIRLGRDSVSVCAQSHGQVGCVRFGFTVGKHNVPRSVDRALVKRVLREVSRIELPAIRSICEELGIGVDISLRYREPLKIVAPKTTVQQAKDRVRRSAELCLKAVRRRLPDSAQQLSSGSVPYACQDSASSISSLL